MVITAITAHTSMSVCNTVCFSCSCQTISSPAGLRSMILILTFEEYAGFESSYSALWWRSPWTIPKHRQMCPVQKSRRAEISHLWPTTAADAGSLSWLIGGSTSTHYVITITAMQISNIHMALNQWWFWWSHSENSGNRTNIRSVSEFKGVGAYHGRVKQHVQ